MLRYILSAVLLTTSLGAVALTCPAKQDVVYDPTRMQCNDTVAGYECYYDISNNQWNSYNAFVLGNGYFYNTEAQSVRAAQFHSVEQINASVFKLPKMVCAYEGEGGRLIYLSTPPLEKPFYRSTGHHWGSSLFGFGRFCRGDKVAHCQFKANTA